MRFPRPKLPAELVLTIDYDQPIYSAKAFFEMLAVQYFGFVNFFGVKT